MMPLKFIILDAALKGAHLAEVDPHGWTVTIVSVLVIFSSLFILFLAYQAIGMIFIRSEEHRLAKIEDQNAETDEGEVHAAIASALHKYLESQVHDSESYRITIKRKNR